MLCYNENNMRNDAGLTWRRKGSDDMCKPAGDLRMETTEEILKRREEEYKQAKLEESIRKNEEETEFLELNAQGQLVTEEETHRERLMAAQPADAVQAAPEEAIEGPPVQTQVSWKDRHIRQKGAGQLREMVRANNEGTGLQVRSRRERSRDPMDIDKEALAGFRQEQRMREYQEAKIKRDQAKADENMEYYSRNVWRNMEKDTKDRPGRPSGRTQLRELEETSTLTVLNKAIGETEKLLSVIKLCGDRTPMEKNLREEGLKVLARARGMNSRQKEYLFRKRYVLPVLQSRGVKRMDMVDSLDRMEQSLNALVPEVYQEAETFITNARAYIDMRGTKTTDSLLIYEIRRIMPDYGMKGEIVDLEEEEQRLDAETHAEVVDLEEEEKKLGAEPSEM